VSEPGQARFRGFGWRPLGRREPVVADLDLTIEAGQRVLLAGPSGAGKSTLLLALVGALGHTVAGDVSGSAEADGRVGLLLQNPGDALVAERIGREIAFGPENLGLSRDEIARRVDAARAAVALPYPVDHPVAALSGGEQQRLALAGTLAMQPGLLLLDEPTAMLDAEHAAHVRESVVDVVDRTGATLVVVEHHLEPWLAHVDRVVVLGADGTVVADTTPAAFVEHHRDALGAQGVWMPGLAAPVPQRPASDLVLPDVMSEPLVTEHLGVTLVRRGLRGSTTTVALHDVDARFDPGDVTLVTGPSGAGKSTLVAALGGLQAPTEGVVHGWGGPPHRLKSPALAARLGWVPQNPEHGLLARAVAEEVALTATALDRPVDVEAVLAHLGLEHLASTHPFRLSGGEQRRLALAAALAHRPGVVLLDEPTVGQDRLTWAAIVGWMRAAADAGAVVVASSHDAVLADAADARVSLAAGART
jgi:energy-coupling factor transport system ATP-binding protein